MLITTKVGKETTLWETAINNESVELANQSKSYLCYSENLRLKAITSTKRKHEYLVSRWLMRQALCKTFNQNEYFWDIEDKPKSLPKIRNMPNTLFYSLSHSQENVCFVLSKQRVGIDVEKIRFKDKLKALAKQFMHPEEIRCLEAKEEEDRLNYFYFIWSTKEAFYKTLPQNKQKALIFSQHAIEKHIAENEHLEIHNLSCSHYAKIVVCSSLLQIDI